MTKILEQLNTQLKHQFPTVNLEIEIDKRNITTISGVCASWQQLVDIGHAASKVSGVVNVVSNMTVKGLTLSKKDYTKDQKKGQRIGVIEKTDVVIVGAGVIGCGIARELSKYPLKIVVLEKNDDVCTGASKANNGNIHPGHAVQKGTLKHEMNILGNRMYDNWAKELGFVFQRNGLMYIAWENDYLPALKDRYQKGIDNGVDGIRMLSIEEAMTIEPELRKLKTPPIAALWLPSLAHVEPYDVTVALAENAADNGVDFHFNSTVCGIKKKKGKVQGVVTPNGIIEADYIINCAGVYADDISEMAGDRSFTIHPRKGTIAILDKAKAYPYTAQMGFVSSALENRMQHVKNSESKGGGCCRAPEGNYLLGPSAKEIWDKEDTSTDAEGLAYAMSCCQHKGVDSRDLIRVFSGVRAADFKEDFIIEMSPVTAGFINVAGIQSPGLASAPAIAAKVEGILLKDYNAKHKALSVKISYNPIRKPRIQFRNLPVAEKIEIIKKYPEYGKIVCRCETITEGEILEALNSPIIPGSLEAIKRRTRAGMGRCQGGFCTPKVVEILAKKLGVGWNNVKFSEEGTEFLHKL